MGFELHWENEHDHHAHWDYCELDVETETDTVFVSPFIGRIPGPDNRWIATLDVSDGTGHGIRSLFPPELARDKHEAKAMIAAAIQRMISGPTLAEPESSEDDPIAS